jgi:hypothetical protein
MDERAGAALEQEGLSTWMRDQEQLYSRRDCQQREGAALKQEGLSTWMREQEQLYSRRDCQHG